MADKDRWERGQEMIQKVYAGDVQTAPRGTMPFTDIMLETLFAEVWSRTDVMSMRDRRLLLLGAICALGEPTTFQIQARAALKNGELSEEELREVLVMLASYAGYPRVSALVVPVEQTIAEFKKSQAEG